ncbi:hypothetical protein GQ54DRAFT_298968 [Martensiomyces pterosporus]|nr:hypothetical protein GQ54DRAFT_298968 [Martensiomyces pterosporus]
MRSVQAAVLLLLSTLAIAAASETFEVYHNPSPNPGEFVQRGEVRIHDDGTAAYQPIGIHHPPTLPDVDDLAKNAAQYSVILRSAKSGLQHILPVKRCRLNGDSKLEETFVLYEAEKGDVFHVDYDAGRSDNCLNGKAAVEPTFSTKVLLRRRAEGPTPKLAFAASIDVATGKEQKPEEQKSFFAKYWYYIVPMVLMLLLSGGEEPQQEGNARR